MKAPLDGVRVLEFSSFISGPSAAQMLGDLGAEVIKIESPNGDGMRRWMPNKPGQLNEGKANDRLTGPPGYASGFQAYNRNKRSLLLDLRRPEARDIVQRMIPSADVVIENMRPGVTDQLGIGYDQVRRVNPSIIYCSVTGFGRNSKFAQRATYDTTAQALSGVLSLMVNPADPRPVGLTICDNVTALYAMSGVLAALYTRAMTGIGQRVEVSMVGAGLAFVSDSASRYFITGRTPTAEDRCAVSQAYVFLCKDGRMLAVHLSMLGKFWLNLTAGIDRIDLRADSRFATADDRIKNYPQLYEELKRSFAEKPIEEWLPILEKADVAHEPVLSVDEALSSEKSSDPIWSTEHPAYGTVRTVAPPIELSETPLKNGLPPPGPGEHSEEILAEHGFSPEEIREFLSAGVLGSPVLKRGSSLGEAKTGSKRPAAGEG